MEITTYSDEYLRCLDKCYDILERYQKPGIDKNKWDFHACMDECRGRLS